MIDLFLCLEKDFRLVITCAPRIETVKEKKNVPQPSQKQSKIPLVSDQCIQAVGIT